MDNERSTDSGQPQLPMPPYVRYMAGIPAAAEWLTRGLRKAAVDHLDLIPGDRVLDMGCGTGSNFPYLVDRIGQTGEVVGVEISPEMASLARQLIAKNGWQNVTVLAEAAQTVELSGKFDALLIFAAHEVLTSPQALDNLFPHLKEGARVVTFGAKLTSNRLGWITNPLFRLASKKWLPFSVSIDSQPWRLLAERTPHILVEERAGGAMYLAWGRLE